MATEDAYAFRFDGREYRLAKLMLGEARAIQKATGKTIGQFDQALADGDVECLAALIWVAQKRENPTLKFEDVDGDLLSFSTLDEPEPRAEGNGHRQTTDTVAVP